MNIEAITIANDLALGLLISALQESNPEALARFAAGLDTIAAETTDTLTGPLGTEVRDRLSRLAAAATPPTREGAH